MGKRENAGNQHFLFFPQFFQLFLNQFEFLIIFLLFAKSFILDWYKSLSLGLEHFKDASALFLPFSKQTYVFTAFPNVILDTSKLKLLAKVNFKLDENGGKFSKRQARKHCGKWQKDLYKASLKTLWEKKELLLTEIYPFPAVFSKGLYCRHVVTSFFFSEMVKYLQYKSFKKHCKKRSNLSFFLQRFLLYRRTF